MRRREFLAGAAGLLGAACAPRLALANVPTPYTLDLNPPMDNREKFIAWGVAQRGEDPKFLGERFDRFQAMVRNEDLLNDRHKRAFLLTPREKFVLQQNLGRAYDHAFLDIGYGVTISGPHIVGRMTSNIDPKQGEKVLEIGTGSGYQSAYLSHLTDKVYTIEIIKPLAERTRGIYDALIKDGYNEFGDHVEGGRRLLRLGRGRAVRQDHRHLRHRPRAAAAAAAAEAERHHGHSGRAARRAARAQGGQDRGRRRPDHRRALRHLRRPDRAVRAVHQARGRQDQRHAQQLTGAFPSIAPRRSGTKARRSFFRPRPARTS